SLPDVKTSRTAPVVVADIRKSVKLVAPRFFDLTQKDPNKGKVTRQLDVRSALPASPVPVPPAPLRPPALIPGPPAQSPPPAPVIEVPASDVAGNAAVPAGGPVPQLPPPPERSNDKGTDKSSEKPKLAFESLAAANARPTPNTTPNTKIPVPRNSVQDAS